MSATRLRSLRGALHSRRPAAANYHHHHQRVGSSPSNVFGNIRAAACNHSSAPTTTTSSTFKSNSTSTPAWRGQTAAVAAASLLIGYTAGRSTLFHRSEQYHNHNHHHHCDEQHGDHHHGNRVLPNGLPRTCCDDDNTTTPPWKLVTPEQRALPDRLRQLVGSEHVYDGSQLTGQTQAYLKGARLGGAPCLCIVAPQTLHDVVAVAQAVVEAGATLVPQGANTGLTGGSVPRDTSTTTNDWRPTVVLSLRQLNRLFPLDDGQRVCCLAGVGLAQLQQFLQQHFPHRESHSVLGSTFLNPTTAAGVALGSGGTQMRKGPAYTERALYLKLSQNKWKETVVEIVNTLGIDGMESDAKGESPRQTRKVQDSVPYVVDTWSRWIAEGYERTMRYSTPRAAAASDVNYRHKLCQPNPQNDNNNKGKDPYYPVARYNADVSGPEFVRSEGKVILLATVHDTFPKPVRTKTYWVSCRSLDDALIFRRDVCLDNPVDLPIQCEYLNQDSYDVIDRAGRVLGNLIKYTGTSSAVVATLWKFKLWVEGALQAPLLADQILYRLNNVLPALLPRPIQEASREYEHHIAVTVGDFEDGDSIIGRFEERLASFRQDHDCAVHDASSDLPAITAFRFVAAPAFRTWCVGQDVQGVSVDYALPIHSGQAPDLSSSSSKPLRRMRYSHFGCNVVHEDLAYANGVDVHAAKYALKDAVEHQCHGKLPAEHGHGTEYVAPPETQEKWQRLDPLNVLNPGVGGTSDKFRYEEQR